MIEIKTIKGGEGKEKRQKHLTVKHRTEEDEKWHIDG